MRALCSSLAIAMGLSACASIPDLPYAGAPEEAGAERDGAVDALTADGAGVGGGTSDGAIDDANVQPSDANSPSDAAADALPPVDAGDALPPDASDDAAHACPDKPPPGAQYCCDTTACRGQPASCMSECTNCKNNCTGRTCCLDHNGNYQGCADTPGACKAP